MNGVAVARQVEVPVARRVEVPVPFQTAVIRGLLEMRARPTGLRTPTALHPQSLPKAVNLSARFEQGSGE